MTEPAARSELAVDGSADRIESFEVTPYRIPFVRPFRTARAVLRHRHGLILRLRTRSGLVGVGEAAPPLSAPPPTVAALRRSLAAAMPRLVDQPLATSLLSHGLLADLAPAAAYAVESALCDLLGQAASQPVAALIGRMAHTRVPLNATLGVSTDEDSVREARRAVEAGFRCLKVKVDAGRLREEIRRLALVREAVGPDVGIRVDVNGSWTLDQAADACRRLEPLGIDYVEQPVATAAELAELRRRVRVRIAADESVTGPQAAAEIAAAGAADVVVVKPAWLGIAASRRIVDIATAAGLSIVVTSVLDTTIGIAAALHFAASVPGNLPPCGLATAGLLASDLAAEPPMVDRGEMLVPLSGGLGVTLDEAALGRWAESPG